MWVMADKGRGAYACDFGEGLAMSTETLSVSSTSRLPVKATPVDSTASETPLLQHILVPVDLSAPSLKAVEYAVALAAPARATVQLTYVVEPGSHFCSLGNHPLARGEEEIVLRSEQLLAKVAEENRFREVMPDSGVRIGNPAEEILAYSQASSADLLVVSTHGRTGLQRVLMGSIAQKIVRGAKCAVLVVRKDERDFAVLPGPGSQPLHLQRILVPIDFAPSSAETLRYAVKFAQQYGGRLTLFHSIPLPSIPWENESVAVDSHELLCIQRENALRELGRLMDAEVPSSLRLPAQVEIGAPLAAIPDYAAKDATDLIICGRHGKGRLSHALLGSVAEGLVRHASCPVLVVPCA